MNAVIWRKKYIYTTIYTLIVRQIFNIYESSRNILPSNIIEKVFSPMTKRLESKQYPTLAILGIADVFFIHEHKWKLLTLLGIRITATVIWLIGSEERTSKYYSLVDWSISIFFGSFSWLFFFSGLFFLSFV